MSRPVVEMFREFQFEAAHWLPHVRKDHKDRRLHGHSYRVRVKVRGPVDERTGYMCDFAELKSAFAPIDRNWTHHRFNDLVGLENPTSELLAIWVWGTGWSIRFPGWSPSRCTRIRSPDYLPR